MEATEVMESPEGRAAAGMLGRMWWIWLVTGILWVLASMVILEFNTSSVTTLGVIIGIMFLVAGLQEFVMAAWAEGWKWLWAIFGVIFVICGVVSLVNPKETVTSIADILGFLFLMVGIFWVIEGFATKSTNEMWWLGLLSGILMVIMAFWAAQQFYTVKVYTLLAFAGIWGLMHGITDIVRAFMVRKMGKMAAS
jgi:uncharacterized membrane protein HdeD (DUF308 family)